MHILKRTLKRVLFSIIVDIVVKKDITLFD